MSDHGRRNTRWRSLVEAAGSVPGIMTIVLSAVALGIVTGLSFSPSLGTALIFVGFFAASGARNRRSHKDS
jgi:hypothetical protein